MRGVDWEPLRTNDQPVGLVADLEGLRRDVHRGFRQPTYRLIIVRNDRVTRADGDPRAIARIFDAACRDASVILRYVYCVSNRPDQPRFANHPAELTLPDEPEPVEAVSMAAFDGTMRGRGW